MSSSSTTAIIEHIVLFQAKPKSLPDEATAMLASISALPTLIPDIPHLAAAPILRHHTSSPFTHVLHARFPSKHSLTSYATHSAHLAVVETFGFHTCDDIMAVDFVSDLAGPVKVPPGKGVRVRLVKAKDGEGLEGVKGPEQVSFGENFERGRGKGYEWGRVEVFAGEEEMGRVEAGGLGESVIEFDFVVPSDNGA